MTLIIIARVLLSVSANAVQKRLVLGGAGIITLWISTYVLILIPVCWLAASGPAPGALSFWGDVFLGGTLDAVGNLAMVAALRATDLSIFGPLNAFRPVFALLFGWLFLHETPTVSGAVGIAITVFGTTLLFKQGSGGSEQKRQKTTSVMLALRFGGLALSTLGAVFLKRAALSGSVELTLAGWVLCALVCLTIISIVRRQPGFGSLAVTVRQHGPWVVLHAMLFFALQWFTIQILRQTLLAYAFVFFQLAMVLQVIAGRVLFQELSFGFRLTGCVIMSVGSGLILWKG